MFRVCLNAGLVLRFFKVRQNIKNYGLMDLYGSESASFNLEVSRSAR